ncbi:N-acetyl-alpha-D-glucosaminyl L-malate synthase BshA [Bacillus horti]|uniref:N-acetyl-alpha-D-glucosaminyl L-malate synthase BshA n=1 Tax=Caldalkalibacillus horti TaxID=77523 RepID=A0ABT9VX81_9BACI|nr:N-acetyl-alpha-D-glucosaminyl L-malate synthase BshA [Bacillus horti]MDQ0165500.1 N-acetyl-alpha-D-glucosaminyl L-malate synthase BshA [Bacillus horti]
MSMTEKRLKIGITCYPTLGGSGVIATELGKLLAEKGHQVHFITSSMPFRLGKYHPNIFFHEVEVNHYSVFRYPPYDLTLASRMAQVANMEKLDILHVHYAVPHAICAFLAKQMIHHPIKIITTLHGTDITVLGYDDTLKDMIRFGIEQSDRVTAVSDELIKQTHELLNINKEIDKIYNFVDSRVYFKRDSTDLRERYSPNGEKLLIHISNFRPVKRVTDVVQIFRKIVHKLPAKLLLIGEGPELSRTCEWVQENGLNEHVVFLGKQEDVSEILSQMDLMLLPSEKESFGLVALEAMSCGVPVIASNAGGLPELIDHGQSGFTYPVGEVEAMAESALGLLMNEEQHKSFSQASIKRATTMFSADKMVGIYEDIYFQTLTEQ